MSNRLAIYENEVDTLTEEVVRYSVLSNLKDSDKTSDIKKESKSKMNRLRGKKFYTKSDYEPARMIWDPGSE